MPFRSDMTSSLLAPTHVVRGWELLNGAVFSALSLWCLIAGACLNVRLIGFKLLTEILLRQTRFLDPSERPIADKAAGASG